MASYGCCYLRCLKMFQDLGSMSKLVGNRWSSGQAEARHIMMIPGYRGKSYPSRWSFSLKPYAMAPSIIELWQNALDDRQQRQLRGSVPAPNQQRMHSVASTKPWVSCIPIDSHGHSAAVGAVIASTSRDFRTLWNQPTIQPRRNAYEMPFR